MTEQPHTAVLGAGLIGASWAALFLASGRSVAVFDPAPGTEGTVRAFVARAWPTMTELGLTAGGTPDALSFRATAADAAAGAAFIQESVPERLPVKHALFREVEPVLDRSAIVATSASGLTLGQMQEGWADPSRLVLGHPFNPPHLIPLVEVVGNDRTPPGLVDEALDFYRSVGKVTIRLNREVPGHVANRLQAALWREAIHLVLSGVTDVEGVEGGLSRAGPQMGGHGVHHALPPRRRRRGLGAFVHPFQDTFNDRWEDLGQPYLDKEVARTLLAGVEAEAEGAAPADLAARRDALLLAIRKATAGLR